MDRSLARLLLFATVAAAVVASPAIAQERAEPPTLAVVDFDATPGGWTLPPPHIGTVVGELLVDQLVGAQQFRVLDGQWLRYGTGQLDAPKVERAMLTAAREAGVDYLVFGSVTGFSDQQHKRAFGGAGFPLPGLGGFHREQDDLTVSIMARVVNVRSGEIVTTAAGNGKGSRKHLSAGGLLLGRLPLAGAFSSGTERARDAQLDDAVRSAVSAVSTGLINAAARFNVRPHTTH